MIRIAPIVLFVIASSAALAKDIACSGTLIDVDMKPGAAWPLAVVYDIEGHRACVIDRLNVGHDPFRGACNVGEGCTVHGSIGRKIGETYFLDPMRWNAEAPADSPLRRTPTQATIVRLPNFIPHSHLLTAHWRERTPAAPKLAMNLKSRHGGFP